MVQPKKLLKFMHGDSGPCKVLILIHGKVWTHGNPNQIIDLRQTTPNFRPMTKVYWPTTKFEKLKQPSQTLHYFTYATHTPTQPKQPKYSHSTPNLADLF